MIIKIRNNLCQNWQRLLKKIRIDYKTQYILITKFLCRNKDMNRAEFLKHLQLKQNVVYVAPIINQIAMTQICTNSTLTILPIDNNVADFQFTFKKYLKVY